MRLAIFGGTGRSGQPLVAQALTRGYEVTALVRSTGKAAAVLPPDADGLTLVEGDLLNAAAVSKAVAGTDAVTTSPGRSRVRPRICSSGRSATSWPPWTSTACDASSP